MKGLFLVVCVVACVAAVQCAWVKEMENPDLFEGDIVLDPDEWVKKNRTHSYCSIKGGRWPGAKVPYVITSSIGPRGVRAIHAAIAEYHKYTCIRFHGRTNEISYIRFYRGNGCNSPIGYRYGRVNSISLAAGCWWTGTTQHEIGHSLGFDHEQNRPDRDKYVDIIWNNIQKGLAFAFYKQPKERIDSLGTPYDLKSTMHYGTYAFGGGRMTIRVKDPSKQSWIGDNRGFSKIDIRQLNLMYCKAGRKTEEPVTQGPHSEVPHVTTQLPAGCDNKNAQCEAWAKRGECIRNYPWMKANCCKACKEFGCPGGCKDTRTECGGWARSGYCEGSHGAWMRCNCCLACKAVV